MTLAMATRKSKFSGLPATAQEQYTRVHIRTTDDVPPQAKTATDVIPDPMEKGAGLVVTRSVRDDILFGLKQRSQIDEGQYLAGRKYEAMLERSTLGGARAIDTTKEAVDGGRQYENLTESQIRAFWELDRAKRELGRDGDRLIRDILGARISFKAAASLRRFSGERGTNYVGRRFGECLTALARLWGFGG